MAELKIISDSSCDISPDYLEKYDIGIVPYLVSLDRETYYKENIEITVDEFYNSLRTQNVFPKTSLPPIQDYIDEFQKYLEKGQDILCFTLTSKFSGSYQSAINAANILYEKYPGRQIDIVDSMTATAAQGVLVLEATKMRDAGFNARSIIQKVDSIKVLSRMYVTVDSLEYLQKGGRIGKVGAFAGGLLNIKPLIAVKDGELIPLRKVRGRKKALSEIIDLIRRDIDDKADDYEIFIMHADEREEAKELAEEFRSYGYIVNYPHFDVGVTIGAHIGPTAIGIGYVRKYTSK